MRRLALVALMLSAPAARAAQGDFAFFFDGGVAVADTAPLASDRAFASHGAMEYGVSERWALASSLTASFHPDGVTMALGFGPRLMLLESQWAALHAFASPEFVVGVGGSERRGDVAARAGLVGRYLLMWGFGLALEASVRWNAGAWGSPPRRWEAMAFAGIFMQA